MRSQPVVAGDTVFLGSKGAHLLALDRRSGCVRWAFKTDGPVALGADARPHARRRRHAVLRRRVGDRLRGRCHRRAAALAGAREVVPDLDHQRSDHLLRRPPVRADLLVRGGGRRPADARVLPLATAASRRSTRPPASAAWRFDTTPHAAKTYLNRDGVQMWGPSGAVVWNSPTIDAKRGAALLRHRPELLVARHRHQRRDHRARPEDRRAALGRSRRSPTMRGTRPASAAARAARRRTAPTSTSARR